MSSADPLAQRRHVLFTMPTALSLRLSIRPGDVAFV